MKEHLPPFLESEPATLSLNPAWALYGDQTEVELPGPNAPVRLTVSASAEAALQADPWVD